jgi:hypothetical protein
MKPTSPVLPSAEALEGASVIASGVKLVPAMSDELSDPASRRLSDPERKWSADVMPIGVLGGALVLGVFVGPVPP